MNQKNPFFRVGVLLLALLSPTFAHADAPSAGAVPAQRPMAKIDSLLVDAAKATWIVEGQGRHPVYIFFDPNCPACQALYKNLRSFLDTYDWQLRWIPVAVVDVTSAGRAAAILQAPDPVAAFRRNEEQYHGDSYSGGLVEDIPTVKTEHQLRYNETLLNRLDIPVVPSMVFADKNGRAVLIQGALSPVALRKVFSRLP